MNQIETLFRRALASRIISGASRFLAPLARDAMALWRTAGDRRLIPLIGAAAVIVVLSAVLFGTLAVAASEQPSIRYSLDSYRMSGDCIAGDQAYVTPDGRLWAWQDGWAPADPAIREACR